MIDDEIERKTIENIKDIIHPHFCLEIIQDKIAKIVLTEQRANLKKVTIYGFEHEKTYAFKLDAKDELKIDKTIRISEYLNPNAKQAINRGSDGIIFTYLNGRGYVFICEMKSGISQKKDYIQQFRNSSVFVKFINNLLTEFYEMKLIRCTEKKNAEAQRRRGRRGGVQRIMEINGLMRWYFKESTLTRILNHELI